MKNMSSENKQNGFPKRKAPKDEQSLNFTPEELGEFQHLLPAKDLWPLPADTPDQIRENMPGEAEVLSIYEGYFGNKPPANWTLDKARAMVNLGRKRIYRWWKQGKSEA